MSLTTRQIVPALLIPLLAWRVYSRVRRNIGRQPFHPSRLKVSIGIFSAITVVFAVAGLSHPLVVAAQAGGVLLSLPLAWYGLALTRFETTPQGRFYTPNTALGIAISTLFVGRLAYRLLVLHAMPDLASAQTPLPFQSPLTFFLFGLSAGYFIAYQTGVLVRSHRT